MENNYCNFVICAPYQICDVNDISKEAHLHTYLKPGPHVWKCRPTMSPKCERVEKHAINIWETLLPTICCPTCPTQVWTRLYKFPYKPSTVK